MKEYTYSNAEFTFSYPDNWEVAEIENLLNICEPVNGVGVLQFSFYLISDTQNIVLKDELEEYLYDRHKTYNVAVNSNYAFSDIVDEQEVRSWRYWIFLKKDCLVFATYNCEIEDAGKEDAFVTEIMKSILER